jgi:glycosyltransferase involved in cell wall biosynthesis
MPFFSIIIPTFNRAKVISKIIGDLKSQTFTEFELIVVDDGSTDGTADVIREFNNDNRIKYIYQENMGVCNARNKGVPNANGDYIIFLDSDDGVAVTWLEDYFELSTKNFYPDLLFCLMKRVNQMNNEQEIIHPSDQGNGANGWGIIIPGAFAVKKSFFEKSGFYDSNITYGENSELFFRLQLLNPTFAVVEKANFIYYPSLDGGSKNLNNKLQSNLYVLRKHELYFSSHLKLKQSYLQTTAVTAARLGDYKLCRSLFIKALQENKTDIKLMFQYLVSVFPFFCKLKWKPLKN